MMSAWSALNSLNAADNDKGISGLLGAVQSSLPRPVGYVETRTNAFLTLYTLALRLELHRPRHTAMT